MPAHIGRVPVAYDAPGLVACRAALRGHARTNPVPAGPQLVAYSGGPDSTALLASLLAEGLRVEALIVDHGLHPEHERISSAAAHLAVALGAQAHIVPVVGAVTTSNTEASARAARYEALSTWAHAHHSQPHLWVGHTADDQAETVLIGLLRGNPQGMLPVTQHHNLTIHRPLLGARRADTHNACEELDLASVGAELFHDPTNHSDALRRGQLRTQLLPQIETLLGGDPIPALALAGNRIAADTQALDDITPEVSHPLPIKEIRDLPTAIRRRALTKFLLNNGAKPTSGSIHAIDQLVINYTGQGPVAVAATSPTRGQRLVVTRTRGMLEVTSPHKRKTLPR